MQLDDIRGRATITVPEAAILLGVSRDAAYVSARNGTLPGVLRLGRRVLVSCPALLAWLGAETDEGPGEGAPNNLRDASYDST